MVNPSQARSGATREVTSSDISESGPRPGGQPHLNIITASSKPSFTHRFRLEGQRKPRFALKNHLFVIKWLALSLSDRIARNRKSIVCPMIDVIDHDNFGYETQAGDAMRGAFDWEMYYKRIPIPLELQKEDPSEPFE